ncbi:MAG: DUF4389 domain-containing protein [Hyphomicrobium sp.]
MTDSLKKNLSHGETWIRLLYVLLFIAIYSVGEIVLAAVVTLQFGFVLLTGERNENLLRFGGSVSRFIYEVLLYFTFKSDDKPFPFGAWPAVDEPAVDEPAADEPAADESAPTKKKALRKKVTRKKVAPKKAAKPEQTAD